MIHTYIPSDASLLNPERGFYIPFELPNPVDFSAVRLTGYSLVHVYIRLDPRREINIPQDVLDSLNTNFANMREGGVKAIVRFSYNDGPYPESKPDASKKMILHHIQQVTSLLQNNVDV